MHYDQKNYRLVQISLELTLEAIESLREDIIMSISATEAALAQATATINAQNQTLETITSELINIKTIITDIQSSAVDPDEALAGAVASLNTAIQASATNEANIQTAVASLPAEQATGQATGPVPVSSTAQSAATPSSVSGPSDDSGTTGAIASPAE